MRAAKVGSRNEHMEGDLRIFLPRMKRVKPADSKRRERREQS